MQKQIRMVTHTHPHPGPRRSDGRGRIAPRRLAYRTTLKAAREAGIPAIVCGEMASTPVYAVVLVGLGATDLSMTPSSIPRVTRVLTGIQVRDAEVIAAECLECSTPDEVEALVPERFMTQWPHLFTPKTLPAPRP